MAWAWTDTIAMDQLHAGWQKNYSGTHRRNTGGFCFQGLSIEGLNGNGCYTLKYVLSLSAENSQILSHSFFRRLEGWNNIDVVKVRYQYSHKRFSIWINILVSRSLRPELLAEH